MNNKIPQEVVDRYKKVIIKEIDSNLELHVHDDMDLLRRNFILPLPFYYSECYVMQQDRIVYIGSKLNTINFINNNRGNFFEQLGLLTTMIESKELRIGNYVKCPLDETFLKVTTLKNKLIIASKGENVNYNAIGPIPLTEYILLKCGFEKTNRIDFGELKECYANFSFALMIRHNSFFVDWIGGNTEVKYLHTLQNVFYFLTGKELNVEL